METNFHFEEIFQYNKDAVLSEIPGVVKMDEERYELFSAMFHGGYFDGVCLDISKFLHPDLSLTLEKLELAISLALEYLEVNSDYDTPVFLGIKGIEKYYELRGIQKNILQQKEEYYFIRHFIRAFCKHETVRKVIVEYVPEAEVSDT